MIDVRGRVVGIRRGKEKVFLDFYDGDRKQLVLDRQRFEGDRLWVGDIISARGVEENEAWRGRLSVVVEQYHRLLRPKRYVGEHYDDAELILGRCALDGVVREELTNRGYVEASSDILFTTPGSSKIRPFRTEDSHGRSLYLRFTMDLELKRYMTRINRPVFEIGKVFRNMHLDHRRSLLEYRVAECCSPYSSVEEVVDLVETIFARSAAKFGESPATIPRIAIGEECVRLAGGPVSVDEMKRIYSQRVKTRDGPLFAMLPPKEWSPLAANDGNSAFDVELIYRGVGCVHIYQSNVDHEQMSTILERQEREVLSSRDDVKADSRFLEELANGIPPNVSFCIGLDRLLAGFTGKGTTAELVPK